MSELSVTSSMCVTSVERYASVTVLKKELI